MTAAEILRAARELLSDPKRWSRRGGSVNARGELVGAATSECVKWPLDGALWKVAPNPTEYMEARAFVVDIVGVETGVFNARNDHAAILEVLDEAARRAEVRG